MDFVVCTEDYKLTPSVVFLQLVEDKAVADKPVHVRFSRPSGPVRQCLYGFSVCSNRAMRASSYCIHARPGSGDDADRPSRHHTLRCQRTRHPQANLRYGIWTHF